MPTKEDLQEDINERLELDIEWQRLKKDDLTEIHEGLDDETFVKKFVAQLANRKSGDVVGQQVMNWEPGMFLGMAAEMKESGIPFSNLFGGAEEEEAWDDL